MAISIWAIHLADPSSSYDVTRIAAGTVTGVGFLGTGVIIKDKFTVKGLSTAATLWICAAIGLAVGAGYLVEAILATAITYTFIFVRNKVIVNIDRKAPHVVVKAKAGCPATAMIKAVCDANMLNVKNIDIWGINSETVVTKVYFPYRVNPNIQAYFAVEISKKENILGTETVISDKHRRADETHES